ncbi:hypothetical protein BO221_33295 [Archangium sp. Cb G35]|uniref:hypothetical protein n=1 Tax=Archangium sp. Cb G35 TaxID=1920190 RepID=UPI0009360A6C|nr:hypothetical protein [Archangium sp. Cb G35]OJT20066.1 hypothetical protein BO221_33295 [Archangium sp. Cb G35]
MEMKLCGACYRKTYRETKANGAGPEVVSALRAWLTEGGQQDRGRTVRMKGAPTLTPENAQLLDAMASERGQTQYGYVGDLIERICELRRAIEAGDTALTDAELVQIFAMVDPDTAKLQT